MPDKRNRNRKTQVYLNNSLERRIKDYSLAAVGVGAVVFAPSANATIINTTVISHSVAPRAIFQVMLGGHTVMSISNSSTTATGYAGVAVVANPKPNGQKGWANPTGMLGEQSPVAPNALIPGASQVLRALVCWPFRRQG
jgi:hypothetical protein